MSDENTDLVALAKRLGETTGKDHVLNAIKASLNAVPIVGGSIASLMDDYIPESRTTRYEQFTISLAQKLEEKADKLDADKVSTDEFAYLFVKVYENLKRDYQREKLIAYRNILVNSLAVDINASLVERYLHLVEQLSALHLRVLSVFISDARNRASLTPNFSSSSLMQTARALLPDIPEEYIRSCIFDLDQMGITNRVNDSIGAMMTSSGALNLEGRLTKFGNNFVLFISS